MIPKKIHYCWFSNDSMGELQKKCLASWKKYLPNYELIHWQAKDLPMNLYYIRKMYQKKRWAYLSDYMRLYALYHHGGIYLDLDVEVLKSFDNLLDNQVFLSWENKEIDCEILEAHVIGSIANHKYIKDCMSFYEKNFWLRISHPPVICFLLIEKAEKYGYIRGSRKKYNKNGLIIQDKIRIFPYLYFTPIHLKNTNNYKINDYKQYVYKNSYAIHHYASSWHVNGLEYIKNLPWAFMSWKERKDFLLHGLGAIYRNKHRLKEIFFK